MNNKWTRYISSFHKTNKITMNTTEWSNIASSEVEFFSGKLKSFRKQQRRMPSLYLVRDSICLGDALLRSGNLEGAMQSYQSAASDCAYLDWNCYSTVYSRVRNKIGLLYERKGFLADAVEEYKASLYGNEKSDKICSSYPHCKNVRSSRTTSAENGFCLNVDSAGTFFRLGSTLRRLCQFSDALYYIHLAVQIWGTVLGPHHECVARSWKEIAILQFSCGKPVEAEIALSEARNIMQLSTMSMAESASEYCRSLNAGEEWCKFELTHFFAAAA